MSSLRRFNFLFVLLFSTSLFAIGQIQANRPLTPEKQVQELFRTPVKRRRLEHKQPRLLKVKVSRGKLPPSPRKKKKKKSGMILIIERVPFVGETQRVILRVSPFDTLTSLKMAVVRSSLFIDVEFSFYTHFLNGFQLVTRNVQGVLCFLADNSSAELGRNLVQCGLTSGDVLLVNMSDDCDH